MATDIISQLINGGGPTQAQRFAGFAKNNPAPFNPGQMIVNSLPAVLGTAGAVGGALIPGAGETGISEVGGGALGSSLGEWLKEALSGQQANPGEIAKQGLIGGLFSAVPMGEDLLGVGDTAAQGAKDLLGGAANDAARSVAGRMVDNAAPNGIKDMIGNLAANTGKRALVGAGVGAGAAGINDIGSGKTGGQVLGDMLQNGVFTGALNGTLFPAIGAALRTTTGGLSKLGDSLQSDFRVPDKEGVFNEASTIYGPDAQAQYAQENTNEANNLIDKLNANHERDMGNFTNKLNNNDNQLLANISGISNKIEDATVKKDLATRDAIRNMVGEGADYQKIANDYGLFNNGIDPQTAHDQAFKGVDTNKEDAIKMIGDQPVANENTDGMQGEFDNINKEVRQKAAAYRYTGKAKKEADQLSNILETAFKKENPEQRGKFIVKDGMTGKDLLDIKGQLGKLWNSGAVGPEAQKAYAIVQKAAEDLAPNTETGNALKELNQKTIKLYEIGAALDKKLRPGAAGYNITQPEIDAMDSSIKRLQARLDEAHKTHAANEASIKQDILKAQQAYDQKKADYLGIIDKKLTQEELNTRVGKMIGEAQKEARMYNFTPLRELNQRFLDHGLIDGKKYSDISLLLKQMERGGSANYHPAVHGLLSIIPILAYATPARFIGYLWGKGVEMTLEKGMLSPTKYNDLIDSLGKGIEKVSSNKSVQGAPNVIEELTRRTMAQPQSQVQNQNPILNGLNQ